MRSKILFILIVLMFLGCDGDGGFFPPNGCGPVDPTETAIETETIVETETETAIETVTETAIETETDTSTESSVTDNRIVINGKEIFVSGTNVPWNNFGNDFGDTAIDINYFTEAIIKVRAAGGNAIRVWLYTDCSYAPKFDQNGLVYAMGDKTTENVKTLLDIAYEYGVVVDLCLLSFDMMQHGITGTHPQGKAEWSPFSLENNKKLLTTDEGLQAYIDHAVTPLVKAVKGHPAIMCWEVFNEAEGMCTETWGWTGNDGKGEFVSIKDVQKVVNRVAAAIKAADPSVLVSNGCVNPIFSSNKAEHTNYYSDEALVAAGGQAAGTLDFYMVHYYAHWQGADASPFEQVAAHWQLNKPVIIGEFPLYGILAADAINAPGVNDISIDDCYLNTYDNGYAGLMSWQYPAFTAHSGSYSSITFADAGHGLTALYNAHEADVKIKDYNPSASTGNSMQIVFDGFSSGSGAWFYLGNEANYSGASTISARFKLDPSVTSSGSIKIGFVLQTGDAWSWCQNEDFLTISAGDGDWQAFSVNINDLRAWDNNSYAADPSAIKKLVIRAFAGADNFTGAVIVDDVMIGNTVVSDFNDGFGLWSIGEDTTGGVESISSVFSE